MFLNFLYIFTSNLFLIYILCYLSNYKINVTSINAVKISYIIYFDECAIKFLISLPKIFLFNITSIFRSYEI